MQPPAERRAGQARSAPSRGGEWTLQRPCRSSAALQRYRLVGDQCVAHGDWIWWSDVTEQRAWPTVIGYRSLSSLPVFMGTLEATMGFRSESVPGEALISFNGWGAVHWGVKKSLCKLINWHNVLLPITSMPTFIAVLCVLVLPQVSESW